jgi:hypothetical protein
VKVIQVNKPTDVQQLKILFPYIKLGINGIPSYGRVLYRDFDYAVSDRTDLLLEQSLGGYNLDSHLGLCGFFGESGYLDGAKLARFKEAGRDAVVDSSGRVVKLAGIFNGDPDVLDMYFYCSTLRLANRIFLDEGIDVDYLLSIWESPLYSRLAGVDLMGYESFMVKSLSFMDSFYSSGIKFRAIGKDRHESGFDRMARIMNTFNAGGFRNFTLSGDMEEDAYVLASLFC